VFRVLRPLTRAAAALVLLFVSSGADCSGSSSDDGGAGGTGANDLCTASFTPCGGDLTGTWQTVPGCELPGNVEESQGCGEQFDFTKVLSTASFTFRADLTLTYGLSATGAATITAPDACLVNNVPSFDCTDGSVGAADLQSITFPGGTPQTASCQDDGATCTCSVVFAPAPASFNGTYEPADATVTVTAGASSVLIDYCVSSNLLQLQFHNTDGSLSPVTVLQKH
jgi:hypothetical protein